MKDYAFPVASDEKLPSHFGFGRRNKEQMDLDLDEKEVEERVVALYLQSGNPRIEFGRFTTSDVLSTVWMVSVSPI